MAARAIVAAVKGYDDAGIVPTVKHFPGHGTATTDSHTRCPSSRLHAGGDRGARPASVRHRDRQHAPAVMMSPST